MKPINIQLKNISKEFFTIRRGKVGALQQINLEINKGDFFVILGPSGCGKSTLLNIIAGLEQPSQGEILFDDKVVCSTYNKIFFSPKERNIAMVFQSYALYPHLNVFDNIAFPLRIEKQDKNEIEKKVNDTAEMLDIHSLLTAKPKELSGGQKQRVAMARALVREPAVLLLDEPLSNLDAQLRVRMREELKNLQQKLGVTTIYVTHDQVEAMTLGDYIVVLQKGEIQQIGPPVQVYKNPGNTFVANFLGTPPMNLFKAKIIQENSDWFILWNEAKIKIDHQNYSIINQYNNQEATIGIRPEDIQVEKADLTSSSKIKAQITLVEHLGSEILLHVKYYNDKITIKIQQEMNYSIGQDITLLINDEKIHFYNNKGVRI